MQIRDPEDSAGVVIEAEQRDGDLGDLVGLRRHAGSFYINARGNSETRRSWLGLRLHPRDTRVCRIRPASQQVVHR